MQEHARTIALWLKTHKNAIAEWTADSPNPETRGPSARRAINVWFASLPKLCSNLSTRLFTLGIPAIWLRSTGPIEHNVISGGLGK